MSHEDVVPALEDEIAAFWRQARVSARDAARAVHPRLDPTAFPMIAVLGNAGPMRVSALGATLFLDKSAMLAGFALLSTIDHRTDIVLMGAYLLVLGVGLGMTMQNMVLAVQNSVQLKDLGAASATVTFFRSLGGTVGVSVLGAVLATQVADLIVRSITATGVAVPPGAGAGDIGIGSLAQLPPELAAIVRAAYGDATAHIFLVAAILSVVTLVAVALIREVPLRTRVGDDPAEQAAVKA